MSQMHKTFSSVERLGVINCVTENTDLMSLYSFTNELTTLLLSKLPTHTLHSTLNISQCTNSNALAWLAELIVYN